MDKNFWTKINKNHFKKRCSFSNKFITHWNPWKLLNTSDAEKQVQVDLGNHSDIYHLSHLLYLNLTLKALSPPV